MIILFRVLIVVTSFSFQSLLAGDNVSFSPQDPLARLDYGDAFNHDTINRKFMSLMKIMQCEENVYRQEESKLSTSYYQAGDLKITIAVDRKEEEERNAYSAMSTSEWKEYEAACASQLQRARRWAITEPARESGVLIGITIIAVGSVAYFLGPATYGGSIGIFVGTVNSSYWSRGIIKSMYNLYYPPSHPLDGLEKTFALNKCFIPKALWPSIVRNFMIARQNPFIQQQSMNFIEFALGLVILRPRPPLKLKGYDSVTERAVDNAISKIFFEIDHFFKQYAVIDKVRIYSLKMNVSKFVLSLLGKGKPPRYLYLYGPGGIGKTFFTHKLCEWIDQIVEDGVHFENFIVTSAEELEGGPSKPGIFLRTLRNQILARKRGSVVLMDEASWINRGDMISAAKRVFNGEMSRMSTSYFGTGVDGTGIQLNNLPTLVVLSANKPIKEDPLRDRFDVINFPMPTPDTLLSYGRHLFETDRFVQKKLNLMTSKSSILTAHSRVTELKIDRGEENLRKNFEFFIRELGTCKNFREVEGIMPALVAQWYKEYTCE